MRYLTVIIIGIFCYSQTTGQTYELGGFFGGANYIGDVGDTSIINLQTPVVGGIFKWNRSKRHAFRFTALFAQLEGDDSESDESRRQLRDYSFEGSLTELSLGIEYTFWEFNVHSDASASTPYLYTGLTYSFYDQHRLDPTIGNLVSDGTGSAVAIPMVIGFKKSTRGSLVFGIELGARYALTDNLDGSAPDGDNAENLQFGNINNDDWYMFAGVTVTFAFGKKPCYCGF